MADLFSSPFFGIALTCVAWCVGNWVQKKTGLPWLPPLVPSVALILVVMVAFGITCEQYDQGGSYLIFLLTPATAVLALNVYNQRKLLKEYFIPVLAGCLAGSATSLLSGYLLCRLLAVDNVISASLLPRNVTTAISVAIAESNGGLQSLAVIAVMVAGIGGVILAPLLSKFFRITDPVAEGVAIGSCSHALGTIKAMEIGSLQGAMSSVSLCISGIMTSVLVLFL